MECNALRTPKFHLLYNRIKCDLQFNPHPENIPEEKWPAIIDGEDDDVYFQRLLEWDEQMRRAIQPEPGQFRAPTKYDKDASCDLLKLCAVQGLQIIAKLQHIELTPERPEYVGERWHIEGHLVCDLV